MKLLSEHYHCASEQARRVEKALGTRIEHDFGSSGPCGFAAGSGTVTFARLQNGDHEDPAVIFADWRVDSCQPAGICLFGSMGNFYGVSEGREDIQSLRLE
jgi:hypothetical protein